MPLLAHYCVMMIVARPADVVRSYPSLLPVVRVHLLGLLQGSEASYDTRVLSSS